MNPTTAIFHLEQMHLADIARIHTAAFPTSALTSLGDEAIRRYYQWQLLGPHEVVALGIQASEQMAGFCFGGVFHGAMSGFLQKNRGFLTRILLTHPWYLLTNDLIRDRARLALKLLRKRSGQNLSRNQPREKSFGILAIAVDPKLQGYGYGKRLMDEEEKIALERGFHHLHLSVQVSNTKAIRFYESLGWQKVTGQDGFTGHMGKSLPMYPDSA